ncbi:MAG: helix-turn-helix domain-containing protein [Candidatus Paceibacterota bacterium]
MEELNNNTKSGQWFSVDNILIDEYSPKIGHVALAIYICLKRHSNLESYAWPTHDLLAQELNISKRTIIRNIHLLEKYNLVIMEKRRRGGHWANYGYVLTNRDSWYQPGDKKSPGRVTKKASPSDKNNKYQVTESHSKNTNIKNTNIKIFQCKKTNIAPAKELTPDEARKRYKEIGKTLKTELVDQSFGNVNLDDIPF